MRPAQKLSTIPLHIAGVICFFLIHGYSENIGLIPFLDLLFFFFVHVLVAAGFFGFFMWRLRSAPKAGLLTTLIFFFYLFYGAITDFFAGISFLSFLSHYRYLVTVFILGMVILYRYCKRSTRSLQRLTLYLNSVFVLLILYDIVIIAGRSSENSDRSAKHGKIINTGVGDFEKKPDIYFLLMDEYCGSNTLRRYYNYDNSGFERFLRQRGFYVAASPMCNYTATSYSLASMLSMDYLPWVQEEQERAEDHATAAKVISDNEVMQFLRSKGYDLYNYSIFDIAEQPSRFNPELFSFKLKLITSKTLLNRMEKDLLWILQLKVGGKVDWLGKSLQNKFKTGNKNIMQLTRELTEKKGPPKFVYAHFMMPHEPFLFDSTGADMNLNVFDKTTDRKQLNKAYFQYLVYTNKVMSGLVSELQQKTGGQAVIILMSDHGYRKLFVEGETVVPVNNFNAVYFPNGNYQYYYDSISNVNQFRAMFNSLFDVKLPRLTDSCSCISGF